MDEFGLDVEEFLSLDEISSSLRYFENLEMVKKHLYDIFRKNPDDFRSRMDSESYWKLELAVEQEHAGRDEGRLEDRHEN